MTTPGLPSMLASPRFGAGPSSNAGHVPQQHGAVGVRLDGHFAQVVDDLLRQRAEPADDADRPFGLPLLQKAAAGVEIVGFDRRLDLLQRDVVLLQLGGIDQHLILLAVAAHDDHLGDAGQLEQPRPDHPIGSRPQVHPLFERRAERDRVGPPVEDEVTRCGRLRPFPGQILNRRPAPTCRARCARAASTRRAPACRRPRLARPRVRVSPTGARSPPCGPLRRCRPTCRICPMIDAGGVICGRMPSGIGTVASRSMTTCRASRISVRQPNST